MKKLTLSIIAAATLAATGVSFAGGPDHYRHHKNISSSDMSSAVAPTHRSGFYLNGGIGYGDLTDGTDSLNGFVWNAAAGYQFNEYVAVEAGYLALPGQSLTIGGQTISTSTGLYNVLAKGMYPVNDNLDVFAKAGLGVSRDSATVNSSSVSDKHHFIVPIVGAGADYYVTNNVAITGQVLYTFKNGSGNSTNFPASVDGLVGITYKF